MEGLWTRSLRSKAYARVGRIVVALAIACTVVGSHRSAVEAVVEVVEGASRKTVANNAYNVSPCIRSQCGMHSPIRPQRVIAHDQLLVAERRGRHLAAGLRGGTSQV